MMMRVRISLVFLLVFGSLVVSVTAQDTAPALVAITDSAHITLFANGTTTTLADIPAKIPMPSEGGGFEYSVSSDHQWLLQTSYWPAAIAYGRMGEEMTLVPLDDEDMQYYVLSASFSADSRSLVFTIADSAHWKLGIINLETNTLSSLGREFAAIEPDLSSDLPFGNMVPTTPTWNADNTRLYLETMIPFWGCRGPHDLYAINIDPDTQLPVMSGPPDEEVARLGSDVYTIAFSPDRKHLAYVFEDESCSYMGARALALTDLTTNTDEVLVEADEEYFIDIIGWLDDGRLLYWRNLNSMSAVVPTLYLYDRETGEAVELPTMREATDSLVVKLAAQGDALIFNVADEETYNPSYPTTLYQRALTDETAQVISDSVFDWMICGDTLYYETSLGGSAALFSHSLSSPTDAPVEVGTAKTIRLLSCTEVMAQDVA